MLPGRPVDEELAAEIREFRSPSDGETRMFYEIVIAPGYTEAGLAKLRGKSKTLRILEAKPRAPSGRSLRQVAGACFLTVLFAMEPGRMRRCLSGVVDARQQVASRAACLAEVSQTPAHGTDGRHWALVVDVRRPCVLRWGLDESKRCGLHPQAERSHYPMGLHAAALRPVPLPNLPAACCPKRKAAMPLCCAPCKEKGKGRAEPRLPCLQLAAGFHVASSSEVLSYHAFVCPACSWLAVSAG